MRTHTLRLTICLLACLAVPAAGQQAPKPQATADLGNFVKEIMLLDMQGNKSQMVFWFPQEFLLASALAQSKEPRASLEEQLAVIKPYLLLGVQCSADSLDGTPSYQSEKVIRARTVLKSPDGSEIAPLTTVPPFVSIMAEAMQTTMASEGDKNLYILVFPSKSKDGKPLIVTDHKDKLTVVLKPGGGYPQATFVWHTPFDAVTPMAPCPSCKEMVSAKWSFCPWCGAKLGTK